MSGFWVGDITKHMNYLQVILNRKYITETEQVRTSWSLSLFIMIALSKQADGEREREREGERERERDRERNTDLKEIFRKNERKVERESREGSH